MSLGDIPKIPPKYKPRIQKLFNKIKAGETSLEEVGRNVMQATGKVKLNSSGMKIFGDYGCFEIGPRLLDDLERAMVVATKALPGMLGKKVCLIKKGNEFKKFSMGLAGVWMTRPKPEDLQNKLLPIVEIISDPGERARKQIMNLFNIYLQTPINTWEEPVQAIQIHRLEQFGTWLGNDWKTAGIMTQAAAEMADLTTKEVLDKLNEPMDPFCDHALKKCGV